MSKPSLKSLATKAAVSSLLLGVLFSELPKKIGFFRWRAKNNPMLVGLMPAHNYGIEEGFSVEKLYASDLTGQVAIVTGANSGVGYETALALARVGARVFLICRNSQKCQAAAEKIRADKDCKGKVETATVDTSSLESVKAFATEFSKTNDRLDMLVLNAGIYSAGLDADGSLPLSVDGIEKVFATNVVGHHLMYRLLEPKLREAKVARVVAVSSCSSYFEIINRKEMVPTSLEKLNGLKTTFFNLNHAQIYGQSKLAQVYWAQELTERLGEDSSIYVNAAHPGVVYTGIHTKSMATIGCPKPMIKVMEWIERSAMWSAAEGALNQLYLVVATDELVEKNVRGRYFHPIAQPVVHPYGAEKVLQEKVWAFLEELVKDHLP